MSDLQSLEQYDVQFASNYRVTGLGDSTEVHFPCPFCASRGWYVVPFLEFGHSMSPHYCVECGRSARFVFSGDDAPQLVQTSGPEPPEWLESAPPREVEGSAFVVDEITVRSAGHLDPPSDRHRSLRAPRTRRRKPPNLRDAGEEAVENCGSCKSMNRHTGVCQRFLWPVKADQMCPAWTQRPQQQQQQQRQRKGKGQL